MAAPALFVAAIVTSIITATHAQLSKSYSRGPVNLPDGSQLWHDLDHSNGRIQIAFRLPLNFTQEPPEQAQLWLGIGIAAPTSIGMRGADLLSATFANNSDDCAITDRHAPFVGEPRIPVDPKDFAPPDTIPDDTWSLTRCRRVAGEPSALELEVTRKIEVGTGNSQDKNISTGILSFLHAYGEGKFAYHSKNRFTTEVVLFNKSESSTEPKLPVNSIPTPIPLERDGTFPFESGPLENARQNATCFTRRIDNTIVKTIVAVDAQVKTNAVTRVLLYGCEDGDYFKNEKDVLRICSLPTYSSGRRPQAKCNTLFYSWSPGVGRLTFPKEAGIKISRLNRRLIMEVTVDTKRGGGYKNKDVKLILHYSKELRKYEVGTLKLGIADPLSNVWVADTSPVCPRVCTRNFKQPINVFASQLHLGKHGKFIRVRLRTSGILGNDETIDQVKFWSPHLERLTTFQKPMVIQPNNSLRCDCRYEVRNANDGNTNIVFGRMAYNEQCEAHLFFWPAQRVQKDDGDLFYCAGALVNGRQGNLCGSGWRRDDDVCFPAHATVKLRNGSSIPMQSLKVGYSVLVAPNTYSTVFMFTHQEPRKNAFVVFGYRETEREFAATPGHLVYINGVLDRMDTVEVGDTMHDGSGNKLTVFSIRTERRPGLYSPQTLHGDIIVNNVWASTYTSAVAHKAAHAILAPFRSLYSQFGAHASSLVCGTARPFLLRVRDLTSAFFEPVT